MRVFNDFRCTSCDVRDEYFLENSAQTVTCRHCGSEAKKAATAPMFKLPGNDPAGFPTAYDQWAKKREQKMAEERRQADPTD